MKLSASTEAVLLMIIAASMNKSGKILLQSLTNTISKKGFFEGEDLFFKIHQGNDGFVQTLTRTNKVPQKDIDVISIFDPTLFFFTPKPKIKINDILAFKIEFLNSILSVHDLLLEPNGDNGIFISHKVGGKIFAIDKSAAISPCSDEIRQKYF